MKREYDFSDARRGAPLRAAKDTTRITLRLEDEILNWFRQQVQIAGGGSYQAFINCVRQQSSNGEPTYALNLLLPSGIGFALRNAIFPPNRFLDTLHL